MELLEVSETARAREIDAELKKNKWRNEWLDETDKKDRPFRMWLRKGVQPGAAWCLLCGKKIVYKSNGKKSISSHGIETVHVERLNALKHASTLPAASPVLAPLSKMDYLVDAKIRTCAFLAEHCLPLSLAPELVGFCQKLAADTPSLERLAMCRKTATYTMTHGVAVTFRENLFQKLSIFSGPLVEGTFNIMDDIVENDRTSLTSENYEAIALIKSGLHAEKKTSTTMDITHRMRTVCTNAYSTYRDYQQTSRHQKDALKQKRVPCTLR
eukprot:TRINITY_DN2900_c0_g1_i2.p1 TRINITY_DN2900_c0_g1~~TRINITY_DN2900_c0_g1_i2.p1  ORF type:complete len:270 (+),score=47.64 TRINITY_DN2900_c0_g1_i2:279-1088(+)